MSRSSWPRHTRGRSSHVLVFDDRHVAHDRVRRPWTTDREVERGRLLVHWLPRLNRLDLDGEGMRRRLATDRAANVLLGVAHVATHKRRLGGAPRLMLDKLRLVAGIVHEHDPAVSQVHGIERRGREPRAKLA